MASPRLIPSIEQLRQRPGIDALEARYGRDAVVVALRDEAAALRLEFVGASADGTGLTTADAVADALVERATTRLASTFAPSLRPVLNATGVIVHTNLGRAPLAPSALASIARVGAGYSNLEYDLAAGRRGRRDVHAEALVNRLTGAEAAVVVNNNAAATLLLLAALARGREVLISRGELVEIGGGFRVPDVMAQSGAVLREVGTTNRTRAADYAAAIGPRTALILRVHPSNFRIEGFTERPTAESLVALGRAHDLLVAEDLGSGNLLEEELSPAAAAGAGGGGGGGGGEGSLPREPTVRASIDAGFDVVCFSGDKLLGGPQAGILAGRHAALEQIRRHPLMRALRVDKVTYAALEATLVEYAAGRARSTVPVATMLSLSPEDVGARATALAARLSAHCRAVVVPGMSTVGGGSAPGSRIPTRLVSVTHARLSPDALEARLRELQTPVVARIENDAVVFDLRTVRPEDDDTLSSLVIQALTA